MQNKSNSTRILQELVSLEAWHKPLVADKNSPFFVAMSFSDARYDGGDNSPIEFKVQLKRATLVVVCDPALRIPMSSKARVHPRFERTVRTSEVAGNVKDRSNSTKDGNGGKAGISATNVELGGSKTTENAQSSRDVENNEDMIETTETLTQNIRMTYQSFDQEHRWHCEAINGEVLRGLAHDGGEPLLEVTPTVSERLNDLGARVFIRCKAEDFEITDIRGKKSIAERFTGENLKHREAMAKEVIKLKLAEADLEITDLNKHFAEVIVADILAIPDV